MGESQENKIPPEKIPVPDLARGPGSSVRDQELQATLENTLNDHNSESKLQEIKQWLIGKVGKLNDALEAIDQIAESKPHDSSRNAFSTTEISNKNANFATAQIIPEGSELFRQSSHSREIYSIEKGLVKLIRREADGKEVIAAIRYPGWLLGADSAILDAPAPVTAITITACQLTRVPAQEFRDLIRTDADLSWKLHQMMAREVHSQVARLTGIECLSARQRLEEFIWQLISSMESVPPDKPIRLQFPAKHFEIAQFLAVTPQYLSWMIGQLEKDKILKRERGWLIVPGAEKLWHRGELPDPSFNPGLAHSFK